MTGDATKLIYGPALVEQLRDIGLNICDLAADVIEAYEAALSDLIFQRDEAEGDAQSLAEILNDCTPTSPRPDYGRLVDARRMALAAHRSRKKAT